MKGIDKLTVKFDNGHVLSIALPNDSLSLFKGQQLFI